MSTATTAQISVRVDSEAKKGAEEVFEDLGLSMSAAINIFLKTVKRERDIPFRISADPFYSEENIRYLEGIKRDVESGKAHFEEHELLEVK